MCNNNHGSCVLAGTWRAEDETMGDLLQPTHLLIIAIVLLVLFGGKRLPELGKG